MVTEPEIVRSYKELVSVRLPERVLLAPVIIICPVPALKVPSLLMSPATVRKDGADKFEPLSIAMLVVEALLKNKTAPPATSTLFRELSATRLPYSSPTGTASKIISSQPRAGVVWEQAVALPTLPMYTYSSLVNIEETPKALLPLEEPSASLPAT